MIIRSTYPGLTLIRQTDHARICGDMARAWGGEGFEPVQPEELVSLAAAEHDDGWIEWEATPQLNPETGRPYTYIDIPIEQHLEIYRRGIAGAGAHHRYAGVLVSLHGSLLYTRFRSGQPGAEEFLEEQKELRSQWIEEATEKEPELAPLCEESTLMANQDLLFAWDALSLFLCHGDVWLDEIEVPTDYEGGRTRIQVGGDGSTLTLSPFPFDRTPLQLSILAFHLDDDRFDEGEAFRRALGDAEQVRLDFRIEPGGG